jgi:ribose 5-phosphate isomerase B
MVEVKKIAIGCDHAGFRLKEHLKQFIQKWQIEVIDFGAFSESSVDYPDYVHPLSLSVESGESTLGIVICGSGNGAAITANKHQGIRAALCWNTEIASLARAHNDANILSLPSRFISVGEAEEIVRVFLETPFDGGRHLLRINKIPA